MPNNTDSFTWANQYGGDWANAANWFDVTTNAAASVAPGANASATITGTTTAYTDIIGTGAAASLGISGDVLMWGTVGVGGALSLAASADLELDGGATLDAGSVGASSYGEVEAGGGSTVDVAGALTMAGGLLAAIDGSRIQVGTLSVNNTSQYGYGSDGGTILIDGNSSVEVGTAGGAALGALTIDHGQLTAISGAINGNVVVNGTLGVQAGSSLDIMQSMFLGTGTGVGGSGVLALSEGSLLELSVADSAGVQFNGPQGVLEASVLPTGTISGFGATDMIELYNLATGLSYRQTSANLATLTLTNGGKTVGTLSLAGNYTGSLFHLALGSYGTATISLRTIGMAPVQPAIILGTAGADTLTATANKQTLTGLGGGDSLSAGVFTGIDFKDTSANLSGSTVGGFTTSDYFDLTDINPAKTTVAYTPASTLVNYPYYTSASLLITDGTHNTAIILPTTTLATGYFNTASDGSGGTIVSYVTVNTDAYAWNTTLGGYYSNAAKWLDTTTNAVGTAVPSYGNAVTIAGGARTAFANVAGTGFAASLNTTGSVLSMGTLTVGAKVVGTSGALTQDGILALDDAARIAFTGTATLNGLVEVGGSSTLTTAALQLGFGGAVLAIGGGAITSTSVGALPGAYSYVNGTYYTSSIGVDSVSSIEIGPYGSPMKGAFKIDYGVAVGVNGSINGTVDVNGTLLAETSLAIGSFGTAAGSITGYGTLEINPNSTLVLSSADSAGILFAPAGYSGEKLVLAGSLPTGTISGFTLGDVMTIDHVVTSIGYAQSGAVGKLSLFDGVKQIGSLSLAGTYAAAQFMLEVAAAGQYATITYVPTPTNSAASRVSTNNDSYSWNNNSGGLWGSAANWTDVTTGKTPVLAPGAGNAVSIANYGANYGQIISGSGSAASLMVQTTNEPIFTGDLTIEGAFDYGNGAVLTAGAIFSAGALDGYGVLMVEDGSTLTVGGNNYGDNITVLDGSDVHVIGSTFSYINGTIAVDSSSTFEFGAGAGTAGAVTIAAGNIFYLEGGTIAANLILTDSIQLYSGVTVIEGYGGTVGTISGAGTIQIASGTRLVLNAADSASIQMVQLFDGTSAGVLELAGPLPTGTLSGFDIGDIIQIDRAATGVSFSQTTDSTGVLTVTDAAAIVATMTLAGSYTGDMFHLDTSPLTGFGTISLAAATGTAASGATNTGADAYTWTDASGGSWATAANWTDSTTNATATTVPGIDNAVTIPGGVGLYTAIGGNGAAASLATTADVLLTGTIAVAAAVSIAKSSILALDEGAKLSTASATIAGTLEVGGGSSATIAGTANLATGTLVALDGSTVQLGGLVGSSGGVAVDANSVIAIGSAAGAAKGTLTQQSGTTAALTGAITASVVANGTLAVAAGGALAIDLQGFVESDPFATAPTISGTGTLLLTENSTLGLGMVDSAAISFGGPGATLELAALPTATITGFATGDAIQVDKTVTSLSYKQVTATAGTLTLSTGSVTVGTLALAGNYAGAGTSFHLDSAVDGSSATISLQTVGIAMTQPSFIQGTAATDVLTATAAYQTLTGLGGGDTFNAASLAGIDFKDLTAHLNGSTILNLTTADLFDFIDMNSATATASYTAGVLSVTDGAHAATLALGAFTPGAGSFAAASDGAAGTKLVWHS